MEAKVVNPLCSYILEGLPSEPASTRVILSAHGDDSDNAVVEFSDPTDLAAIAELLWEAAVDLMQAQAEGIESVGRIKGLQKEDGDFTVEDILNGTLPESSLNNPYNSRTDLVFPWSVEGDDDDKD